MECDEFEWDDRNAEEHFAKHGVSFNSATAVFKDPFAIEYEDQREHYPEPRYIILGMACERLLSVVYTPAGNRRVSYRLERQNLMSDGDTMKRTGASSKAGNRWARLDAMTAEEKHAAAVANPDAQPLTEEDFNSGKLKRTPQVKIIRRALGLSQEEFAARFHIPVGTLRDWEQGRSEPDAPGRAYLTVIACKPDIVRDALASKHSEF